MEKYLSASYSLEKYHSLNSINIAILKLLTILIFFLSGGDVIAVKIGDSSVRLVFVLLPVVLLFIFRDIRLNVLYFILIIFLAFLLVPSIYFSYVPFKSALTVIWLLLTVFLYNFIVPALILRCNIGKSKEQRHQYINSLVIVSYRLQLVIGLLLYSIGYHERVRAFYYEPSYFSLSLSIYVSVLFYELTKYKKKHFFDWLLLAAFFIFSFSANFILVLTLLVMIYFVRVSSRNILLLFVLCCLFVAYVSYVDDINTSIIRSFWNGDIDAYQLLLRGGNRFSRFLSAVDVFKEHYLFGVGLSGYERFTELNGVVDYSQGFEYLEARGVPVINIYMEVLATTGLIGGFAFLIFILYVIAICILSISNPYAKATLVMLVLLNFESNFLRPYFWLAWALAYFWYVLDRSCEDVFL